MVSTLSPDVECIHCGTKKCDWVTRIGIKGECYDCFYKNHGYYNPKKGREPGTCPEGKIKCDNCRKCLPI